MRKLIDKYYSFLKILLVVMLGLLMVPVCLQIFARFFTFIPRYIWTEEMARFCFIWVIMIGASIAVRDGTHFTVDVLPQVKTKRGEALFRMFVDFNTLLLGVIFIVWGWPLFKFGLLQTSEMAELPMAFIFSAWPLAGFTWILFLGEKFVDNIKLFRSDC